MIIEPAKSPQSDSHMEIAPPAHVAYVLSSYPVLRERFYHLEITGLREAGMRVSVFSLLARSAQGTEAWDIVDDDLHTLPALSGQLWRTLLRARPRQLGQVSRLLRQTSQQPGVRPKGFMIAAGLLLKAMAFVQIARERKIDVVHGAWCTWPAYVAWAIHQLEPAIKFTLACNAYDYDAHFPLTELFVQDADLVFTHAQARQKQVRDEWPRTTKPVACVYRGTALPQLNYQSATARSGLLCVGGIVRYKGFEVLLQALARLRDLGEPRRLTVIGGAPAGFADYQAELLQLTRELELESLVDWRGAQPHAVVMDEMRRAELFVLASLWCDILPNVIKEALACATPVVTTDTFAIDELVIDGQTGRLVPKGDPEALAEAIYSLLRHPEQARTMALAGRQLVVEKFDIKQTSQQRRQLFQNLIMDQ